MEAALPGLSRDDLGRRLEVLHAAGDVGVAFGPRGAAVALVIDRPHVVAPAREDVHHRVLAAAGDGEVEARARGDRRAVDEEEDGSGRRPRRRRARSLAEEREPDGALAGPVLRAPRRRRGGLGEGGRRRAGLEPAESDAEAGGLEHGPSRDRVGVRHGDLLRLAHLTVDSDPMSGDDPSFAYFRA